ncbi:MAG: AAA family ATPase [Leptospiraceae bacterium]|nr:AAA family ATPase [Leptospiraceae bacterium]
MTSLNDIIADLRAEPAARLRDDTPPEEIEVIETHISLVLLAANRAYKSNKSVDLGFIKQTTLTERFRNCCHEVRLNARLAADVYLGVYAVHLSDVGRPVLGTEPVYGLSHSDSQQDPSASSENSAGDDSILEYCVVMRRLPDAHNLKSRIAHKQIASTDMNGLADVLTAFHADCDHGARLAALHQLHTRLTEALDGISEQWLPDPIRRRILSEVQRKLAAVRIRELTRAIVDGHGDLRLDHIYISDDGFRIIDCVEFNQQFRAVDRFEDLAFLTMGCRVEQRNDLALRLIHRTVSRTGDWRGFFLLRLYELYRALVRLRIDNLRLANAGLPPERRAYFENRCRSYARFIRQNLSHPSGSVGEIFLVVGLPASGKSTFAEQLSREKELPIIATDRIRPRMFRDRQLRKSARSKSHTSNYGKAKSNPSTTISSEATASDCQPFETDNQNLPAYADEKSPDAFQGLYAPDFSRRTYRHCAALAALAVRTGQSVILEGTYAHWTDRRRIARLIARLDCSLHVFLTHTDESRARARLQARSQNPTVDSYGSQLSDPEVYDRIRTGTPPYQAYDFGVQSLKTITT